MEWAESPSMMERGVGRLYERKDDLIEEKAREKNG
jgi:hypothetical protein